MSYQVLARRWRPRNFDEVLGQTPVVRALRNGLELGRVHHAYLFAGTRGVGKTTLARILAKCLNCEKGIVSTPCDQCSACRQVSEGGFADLVEIDAASRTGVEDMRGLLNDVNYVPSVGRFKVYLIDEVHMLSTSSFNALLKTLEEPPEHARFFFATTHPGKLPLTVLSRCLQFNLTRLLPDEIQKYLATMLERESVDYEETALRHIALAAEGSVRDSLSLLDQAIAYGNGSVKTQEVQTMLGLAGYDEVLELLRRVVQRDVEGLIELVDTMYAEAVDFASVLNHLIELLHAIAVQQALPGADVPSRFDAGEVKVLAGELGSEDTQLFYQIALNGKRDLPVLPDTRSAFQMTVLRMMSFRPAESVPLTDKASVSLAGAKEPASTSPPAAQVTADTSAVPEDTGAGKEPAHGEPVGDSGGETPEVRLADLVVGDGWGTLVGRLQLVGAEKEVCLNSKLNVQSEDEVTLAVDSHMADIRSTAIEANIRKAISRVAGRDVKVNFTSISPEDETPRHRQAKARRQQQDDVEKIVDDSAVVQSLKETFGAEVVAGRTRPIDDDQ